MNRSVLNLLRYGSPADISMDKVREVLAAIEEHDLDIRADDGVVHVGPTERIPPALFEQLRMFSTDVYAFLTWTEAQRYSQCNEYEQRHRVLWPRRWWKPVDQWHDEWEKKRARGESVPTWAR